MADKYIEDLEVESLEETEISEPPLYKVLLFNDDYTPMEFVIDLLQKFFNMDYERAVQVMLAVHENGRGLCGVFSKDVAETKCHLVSQWAKENQHPLKCDVEPDK